MLSRNLMKDSSQITENQNTWLERATGLSTQETFNLNDIRGKWRCFDGLNDRGQKTENESIWQAWRKWYCWYSIHSWCNLIHYITNATVPTRRTTCLSHKSNLMFLTVPNAYDAKFEVHRGRVMLNVYMSILQNGGMSFLYQLWCSEWRSRVCLYCKGWSWSTLAWSPWACKPEKHSRIGAKECIYGLKLIFAEEARIWLRRLQTRLITQLRDEIQTCYSTDGAATASVRITVILTDVSG